MKKFTKKQIAVFIGWCFLHIILFTIGSGLDYSDNCKAEFWPFKSKENSDCFQFGLGGKLIGAYNITEFLVYVGLPVVLYFILGLFNEDNNKKESK